MLVYDNSGRPSAMEAQMLSMVIYGRSRNNTLHNVVVEIYF